MVKKLASSDRGRVNIEKQDVISVVEQWQETEMSQWGNVTFFRSLVRGLVGSHSSQSLVLSVICLYCE